MKKTSNTGNDKYSILHTLARLLIWLLVFCVFVWIGAIVGVLVTEMWHATAKIRTIQPSQPLVSETSVEQKSPAFQIEDIVEIDEAHNFSEMFAKINKYERNKRLVSHNLWKNKRALLWMLNNFEFWQKQLLEWEYIYDHKQLQMFEKTVKNPQYPIPADVFKQMYKSNQLSAIVKKYELEKIHLSLIIWDCLFSDTKPWHMSVLRPLYVEDALYHVNQLFDITVRKRKPLANMFQVVGE